MSKVFVMRAIWLLGVFLAHLIYRLNIKPKKRPGDA